MNALTKKSLLCTMLVAWLVASAKAQEKSPTAAEAWFQRGFFLQTHDRDLPGAVAAYEKAAAEPSASETLKSEATARLAGLREDLAVTSFARLMPSDVLGYVELVEPGEHIERLLKMLGLVHTPGAPAGKSTEPPVQLGDGLMLSPDFTVSPALVAELKKLRGAAVGVTSINDQGMPSGVAVLHPGDCDLVRGLIETAVQVLPPGDPIEGFATYRVPDHGWVMLTARLVVASDSREQLAATLARLRNPQAESLAGRAEFQRAQAELKNPLVFAYVDGQQAVKRFGSQLKGREAAMIRGLLDLEHFESAAVALSTTDNAIQLRAEMNLMPGHKNMLYALVRTAPISRRSLAQVPKGAVGVVVVGLNPPTTAAPAAADPKNPPSVTAMDIGREFFHNIEELAVFALPPASDSAGGLPEAAAVIAVKDPEKSAALWNQLLTLASLFGARTAKPPEDVTVEGQAGRSYQFDGIPPIVVVRSPDRGLVIGTQGAVAASLRASATGESIAKDEAFAGLLARVTPDTSKAVLIDVGRALQMAAGMGRGRDAEQLMQASQLVRELKVSLVTDEAPNRLLIRAEVSGLPKFAGLFPLIRGNAAPRRLTIAKPVKK
jgi:hypothetical protein